MNAYDPNPLPLEQTDPELAEHLRLMVSGQHPVRGFFGSPRGRVYTLRDGRHVSFKRDPYAPCPCGSGKKSKWCCGAV